MSVPLADFEAWLDLDFTRRSVPVRQTQEGIIFSSMRDDRYRPFEIEELEDKPSLINEPIPPENVGVLVPTKQRSLHAIVAQNLADTENLIGRLEAGVGVADSGRALVRDLYVQCRKQRQILAAVLRLELE
jgi:hypothetical protein